MNRLDQRAYLRASGQRPLRMGEQAYKEWTQYLKGNVARVRAIHPAASPYRARYRSLEEVTGHTRHFRACIADRNDSPVMLFTTISEAQHVAEKINLNMAKEVMGE